MRFLIGTSGFNHPDWRGAFYPDKLKSSDMLGYYALRLRTVELDGFGLPKPEVLSHWASSTPSDFVFTLRASRKLTQLDGDDRKQRFDSLFHLVHLLGHKVGPVLFRCPPTLRKDIGWLESFLAELPSGARAAIEFRSRTWYDDAAFSVLKAHDVAVCVTDFEDPTKIAPVVPTARFGYFRMRAPSYSDARLEQFAEDLVAQPWSEAFVFFQSCDNAAAAKLSLRMLECAEFVQPIVKPVAKAVLPPAPPDRELASLAVARPRTAGAVRSNGRAGPGPRLLRAGSAGTRRKGRRGRG